MSVFRAAGPSLDEPVPMVEPANIPTTLEGRPRRSFRRQLFWIVVACALAVVVGLGVRWYSEAGGRRAGVGLRVEDAGQQLVIRWDHSAAAIVEADSGSMVIQDGKETKNLALDTLSVRGTITYAPEHDDVEVNMTVGKAPLLSLRNLHAISGGGNRLRHAPIPQTRTVDACGPKRAAPASPAPGNRSHAAFGEHAASARKSYWQEAGVVFAYFSPVSKKSIHNQFKNIF